MHILALDPSTTAVGWCRAIDADYLESGVFEPEGDTAWERIASIEGWLCQRCMAWLVDAVAFEVPAGDHGNEDTNRKMGAVEYVIRKVVRLCSATVIPVYPAQVKSTGCSKDDPYPATALAGYTVGGDEADAVGVYLWAWGEIKKQQFAEMGR